MKRSSSSATVIGARATGHQTLSEYISSRFDEFSRSQKDVAQYIVDHIDEAAFQTAEQLAKRANTSSSTVVRFAQALGFDGYPELQERAREEYRRSGPGSSQTAEKVAPLFSLDQTDFEAILASDHLNLEETAGRSDRGQTQSAIDAIVAADRVLICAVDQMAFFGSYLRHLLLLLDIRAEIVASASQESLARLARMDENTLVIALSAGRPHPLMNRAMKHARQCKATTLAISDSTISEIAKLAQIRLYYSSNSPGYVRSHVALLSTIQGLANAVYSRNEALYEDRIKAYRLT